MRCVVPFPSETSRSKLISAWLSRLEKHNRPTVILLDNAECCLEESGTLATCWEAFMDTFNTPSASGHHVSRYQRVAGLAWTQQRLYRRNLLWLLANAC